VLFRLDEPGIASSPARRQDRQILPARGVDRLGYAFGIERRPEDRLHLTATYSYKPFEEGVGEDEAGIVAPGAWGDALIFLTDGAAGRHELGVRLDRAFGGFTGSLTGSVGRVAGRLTPAIEEAPVQILSLGEVRYYLTRLRALYGRTDTEVEIDYRHVQAETGIDDAVEVPGSLDYRRLDLLVAQDLPRLGGALNAKLKILMAYQGLIYGAAYEGSGSIGAAPPMAAARLTGGIDIRF